MKKQIILNFKPIKLNFMTIKELIEELDYKCSEVEVWEIDNYNENYITLFTYPLN